MLVRSPKIYSLIVSFFYLCLKFCPQPDDPEEMARITAWGGFVCPPAEAGLSARVYLDPGFTMIGLAMARSIGEYFPFILCPFEFFFSSFNSNTVEFDVKSSLKSVHQPTAFILDSLSPLF